MASLRDIVLVLLVPILLGLIKPAFSNLSTDFDLRARNRTGANVAPLSPQTKEQLQRILVTFKDNSAPRSSAQAPVEQRMKNRMAAAASEASTGKVKNLSYLRAVSGDSHVYLTDSPIDRVAMQSVIQALANDPAIESVGIDERMLPHAFPNDPDYTNNTQWALKAPTTDLGAANFANAWTRVTSANVPISGAGVVVAVLDSGYLPHADLSGKLLSGYDFISLDEAGAYSSTLITANDGDGRDASALDPGDGNINAANCALSSSSWHGTRVAGIVSAATDNAMGMAGAAYQARVLPVRILGVCGGYISDAVDAIRWAAGITVNGIPVNNNPAKVINMSLGGSGTCDARYQSAIDEVRTTKKVTVVVSTGNGSSNSTVTQPANCTHVIAVTAHRNDGASPNFANLGAGTTLSAPGVNIFSTSNTGTSIPMADTYLTVNNGTSFAAPLVSSVVAMLYQINPGITPDEVASRLVNSARSFPLSTYCSGKHQCGAGMLDADAAVALALLNNTPYANAYASQNINVARGAAITLTGIAGAGANSGPVTSTLWTQVSGPSVSISNATGNVATILTPATSADNSLVFKFRATSLSPTPKTADSFVTINMVPSAATAVNVIPGSKTGDGSSSAGGGGGSLGYFSLLALAALAVWGRRATQYLTASKRKTHIVFSQGGGGRLRLH